MRKTVKFAVIPLAVLGAVAAALVAYVAITFDPNRYKPQIVQAVKDRTQRTLVLEGDIKLSLFPDIGARIGRASLSERGSSAEFASADEFNVALKLRPLLSKQVVIDAIEARNLRANVVRYKDGTTNIDDLMSGDPAPAAPSEVTVDINRVAIANATVTYTDEAAGSTFVLSKLELLTGRIASGLPTPIELSLRAQSASPRLDLATTLKGTLSLDHAQRRYSLAAVEIGAKGLAADIDDLAATARGDAEANAARGELRISGLAVVASGRRAGGEMNVKLGAKELVAHMTDPAAPARSGVGPQPVRAALRINGLAVAASARREGSEIDVKLDASALDVAGDRVRAGPITLDAVAGNAAGKLTAKVDIPGVEGDAQSLTAPSLSAGIDLRRRDGARAQIKLSSAVALDAKARRVQLSRLAAAIDVNEPALLKKAVAITLTGSAQIDAANGNASLAFAGRLDDSVIGGKAALAAFTPPFYTFDVSIDRFDAGRYLPAARKQPDRPFDLSALKSLNASGRVTIGTLTIASVKASNVRLEIKPAKRSALAGARVARDDRNARSSALAAAGGTNAAIASASF